MARKRERAFAGFFAILFLVTASATTIAVIVTLIQQHDQNTNTAAASSTTTTSKGSKTVNSNQQQGDQLANFTPTPNIPQLQTDDLVVGTGATVKPGDTITANYVGAVAATGTIFQSSSQPVSFSLSQVIPGWTAGIPGMKVGGTRRLLIPSKLAYGANPPSGIPANASLVFDVTLTKIN